MMNIKLNSFPKVNYIYFLLVVFSFFILPRIYMGFRLEDFLLFLAGIYFFKKHFFTIIKNNIIKVFLFFLLLSFFLGLYSELIYVSVYGENWIVLLKYVIYFSAIVYGFACGFKGLLDRGIIKYFIIIMMMINMCWCLYQVILGEYRVLFGTGEESSYGIRLIGEAAAFQVGSMLSFLALAMVVSYVEKRKLILLPIIFILVFFIYLSQSRINLISILILVFFILAKLYYRKIFVYIILLLSSFYYLNGNIDFSSFHIENNRFTTQGLYDSYVVRGSEIWADPLRLLSENPFKFYGLGSLRNFNLYTTEMHNYYLKLLFEGGFFYFALFMIFVFCIFNNNDKNLKGYNFQLLLKLYLTTLLMAAFLQDSFASNKAVYPFYFLVGYVMGLSWRGKHEKRF